MDPAQSYEGEKQPNIHECLTVMTSAAPLQEGNAPKNSHRKCPHVPVKHV